MSIEGSPSPWGGPGEDYRLSRINGPVATGDASGKNTGLPAVGEPGPGGAAPVWQVPRRRRSLPWFEILFIGLGVVGVAVTVASYALTGGIASTAAMAALALVPLLFVLALVSYIDRWEPEPLWPRLVSLVWGAGVAALAASIVNTAMLMNVAQVTGDYEGSLAVIAVTVAPMVEEFLKGLGVVIIILWRRTNINSLLDGVVYAGYTGAGFAFVENIQYFLDAQGTGQAALGVTVFLRGVLSPFVHPMATSFTGLALAYAVVGTKSRWSWLWLGPIGWVAAVFVHGLWNYLSTAGALSWFTFYLVVEVPLFCCWVGGLLVGSAHEARRIAHGLVPYVRTGWLLPAESMMVTTRAGRKSSRKWAASGGKESARAMRTFQTTAASLGLDQLIMTRIGPQTDRIANDHDLLRALGESRRVFLDATRRASAQTGLF